VKKGIRDSYACGSKLNTSLTYQRACTKVEEVLGREILQMPPVPREELPKKRTLELLVSVFLVLHCS
jgi:hypothetical protein